MVGNFVFIFYLRLPAKEAGFLFIMAKENSKKIGILGGIGPEATGRFYLKLISEIQKRRLVKSNTDFPQIIINSIPAPELVGKNISRKDLRVYIKGLKELDKLGLDFIVMVCNTIHLFYDELQGEIDTPILDLRKEVKNYIKHNKIKSISILGTLATMNSNLYKFRGVKYIKIKDRDQELLSKSILDFNMGLNKDKQVRIVSKLVKGYLEKGAKVVILGCTEIALMLEKEKIPKIDTLDLLVNSVIKKSEVYGIRS